MPVYKLYYFNSRARGEGIRWLFALSGEPFEDLRLSEEEWRVTKPKMPLGYLPVLEVDGKLLSESKTIGRYLANQFGYAGQTDWEKGLADQYVDLVYDLLTNVRQIDRGRDEYIRSGAKKPFYEEIGPRILGYFESQLESNQSGYLVGDRITWADVFLAAYLDAFIDRFAPEFQQLLDKFPQVKTHLEKIRNTSGIAEFISKRPVTFL